MTEALTLDGRRWSLWVPARPRALLVQPVDRAELETLETELGAIAAQAGPDFALAALEIEDWFGALSPWAAPPVFGKTPFGAGAEDTLGAILAALPRLLSRRGPGEDLPILLGGYSLAGLFALWAGYETDRFAGVAACSPSVWFPGWLDYALARSPRTRAVYLSLGDREEKAKNPVMAQVGRCIRAQAALLEADPALRTTLVWNPGNHFKDPDLRTAAGFAWLLAGL